MGYCTREGRVVKMGLNLILSSYTGETGSSPIHLVLGDRKLRKALFKHLLGINLMTSIQKQELWYLRMALQHDI